MNARQYTDKKLKALEKELIKQYTNVYKHIKDEMTVLLSKITVKSDLSLEEKLSLINRYDRLDKLCNEIAERLKNANVLAISTINQSKKDIFKENYNETAKKFNLPILTTLESSDMVKEIKNPFIELAEQEEKDKSVITRRIKSEMLAGLLLGQGIQGIANRIKTITEKYANKSMGIARGETTTVENTAINDVGKKAIKQGKKVYKRWIAENDYRTRVAHAIADGKEVPFDKPFYVGGEYLMFPGDRSLGATDKNIINCRCRTEIFEK